MEIVRQINDELAISGPIVTQQFQQLAKEGFRAVLNLRSLDKALLVQEQQFVERLGLCYVSLPVDSQAMNPETAGKALQQIDRLPKPVLVYCNNAMLAAAVVLMSIAISQGESLQKAFQRAEALGLFIAPLQARSGAGF